MVGEYFITRDGKTFWIDSNGREHQDDTIARPAIRPRKADTDIFERMDATGPYSAAEYRALYGNE